MIRSYAKENLDTMKSVLRLFFFCAVTCWSITANGQSFNFIHDGINREYIYYEPASLSVNAPLVFVAHGYSGSAQDIRNYSGMNAIADQNDFAVCYPQGTVDSSGDNFWNVGYSFHSGVTVDDIGFLESLASYLQITYQLSSANTFFTGMSNGGEMCYLLAFDGSNVFKAFAPVAGTVFPNGVIDNLFLSNLSIPFFITHGDNDNTTLYSGDQNDTFWGPYLSVDTLVDFWVNVNSLTDLVVDTFPNINNNNKITISHKYSSSLVDKEVWLYTHQSGHSWGDDGDMVIEQEIWDFFTKMSLNISAVITEPYPKKTLINVVDVLGRPSTNKKNTILLYIYDDGSVEKRIIL